MRPSIDFRWVKSQVSPLQTFELLNIEMKQNRPGQWRGICPACNGDPPRGTLVYTDGEGFKCHTRHESGGDQIAFTRFVLDLPGMYEGALELATLAGIPFKPSGTVRTTSTNTSTVRTPRTEPESERARRKPPSQSRVRGGERSSPQTSKPPFDHERYAASLDYEHELLIDAGADLEKMEALGIGYSNRGTHKGMIVIRVTDADGIVSFIGVDGTIHLPPNLRSNVVPLRRQA